MADSHKLGQENGQETTVYSGDPIDFDFLKSQTFGDERLECELLELFFVQSQRTLSSLSTAGPTEQGEKAHLLKGSARSIGAHRVAELADRYEFGGLEERSRLLPALAASIELSGQAIAARLTKLRR